MHIYDHLLTLIITEVTSIEPNSPAFAAGFDRIRPGDFIVEIEGQMALFMTLQEALQILNEDKNEIKLVLERYVEFRSVQFCNIK